MKRGEVRSLVRKYRDLSERDQCRFRVMAGIVKGRSSKGSVRNKLGRPRDGSVTLAVLKFLHDQGPSRSLSVATHLGCAQGTVAMLASRTNYVKSAEGIYQITRAGLAQIPVLELRLEKKRLKQGGIERLG